jgi:hypothetical protein
MVAALIKHHADASTRTRVNDDLRGTQCRARGGSDRTHGLDRLRYAARMATPGYTPQGQAPQSQEGNGMAVAGMVLGIIALVLCWIPFLNWLLALLGIIFGALGIGRGNKVGKGKGMAIAGLVCGIVGALLGVAIVILAVKTASEARHYRY